VGLLVAQNGNLLLRVWQNGGGFAPPEFVGMDDLYPEGLYRDLPAGSHVFFVNATHPSQLPAFNSEVRFHRIVFLTDREPTANDPASLECHLREELRSGDPHSGPYFSSFIATLLVGGSPRPPESLRTRNTGDSRPRFERDMRLLQTDPDEIRRHWEKNELGVAQPSTLFGVELFERYPAIRESMWRWARAVTNRQVGVAISGGGATAYRMVPLFQKLAEEEVPIDMVSGVSGGALIGAYYCKDGLEGLEQAVKSCKIFQLGTLAAMLNSATIRWVVDRDLSHAGIGDLEVRLVALTTKLHQGQVPEPVVVEEGTLGEAVRLSGSAPGLFAPTEIADVRYADGGAVTFVPARILEDYGADLVFACNTIPGPRCGNPFGENELGKFIYSETLLGRVIDLWVTGAFLAQQVGYEAGHDADAYFTPKPQDRPLLESFLFFRAEEIVERSKQDAAAIDAAAAFANRWRQFIV
jgi:predicted acylesterase/phospholipase RssA